MMMVIMMMTMMKGFIIGKSFEAIIDWIILLFVFFMTMLQLNNE